MAIARALINNPSVIIADEPTAHLDTKLSREFMEIMDDLKDEGKTILIASHDPLVYDSALVDRVVEMRDGRITDGARRMILHPGHPGAARSAPCSCSMSLYAACYGVQILRGWDLRAAASCSCCWRGGPTSSPPS